LHLLEPLHFGELR